MYFARSIMQAFVIFLIAFAPASTFAQAINSLKCSPYFTNPSTDVFQSNVTITVTGSEPGTAYYVTYNAIPSTAPSGTDIIQYVEGSKIPPASMVSKGSISVTVAGDPYSKNITNLPSYKSYYTYAVLKNSAGSIGEVEDKKVHLMAAKEETNYYYTEYRPADYASSTKQYALLIFLHGNNESGSTISSLDNVMATGLPREIKDGVDFPEFVIVSPQSPTNFGQGGWNVGYLNTFLQSVKAAHGSRLDVDRIYMTGLSMGGFGTWKYALAYPNTLAAIVPSSGAPASPANPCSLVDLPIWAFHDDPDSQSAAPSSSTKNLYNTIKACAENQELPVKVNMTLRTIKDSPTCTDLAAHSIWGIAYGQGKTPYSNTNCTSTTNGRVMVQNYNSVPSGSTIYSWLLLHSRNSSNNAPSVSITAPANNAVFTAPASVSIAASASDTDGTISKVEFYQGVNKLGEDLAAPYSHEWTNVPAGTYSLTAKAIDNAGAVTTSSAITITVNPCTACGSGDIDHAWADFFDIEGGGSVPANWNDPAVDPVLDNLGTGVDWTAVDATKPTFSGGKLIFANAHRIDGYSTTHPPMFELWVKARYTGGSGNLLSLGNQVIFGVDASGNYVCNGLTPQAGDATEHVFRIVMNGAQSIFQIDGGPEVMFDEGTSLGTKLVMGQTNSGGNSGDFEIKRFQRTAHGTLLTAQEVSDKWSFHGFGAGDGDIDHPWADFFDIESGGSVPANWNDPAVDPVLDNLGTGVDWTAVDATKPTFSGDKLVFDNAHRIDGYHTTHPPVFELWVKARFTGEHGNLLSLGNQLVFGADSNGDYVCNGLTPQAGDANEHVFRIVMNGANSIFQMDGGSEIMFDEGTSLGTKLVMGQTNSGGNSGDFEIKRFQRTAHGTLLTAQEVADKWSFHGFDVGGGDIDHAWADFFDIETGASIPAGWNDPAVNPVLDNLGTGDNWTAVDATKPTFSGDKLVFDNAHRIDGYHTTHPPVFELWVKARFTGEHGNLLSLGNQLIFGADSNGDYACDGLTSQQGDATEHVFRIVMNGAQSIFQMDGGPEVMFDEGTSLGTKLVMGQTNSGGNSGDFEIKRFQRTAHGTLLTAQEVSDKWFFHGFASQQSSAMDVARSTQSSETEEPENYMISVYDNFGGYLKSFRYSARPSEIYGLDLRSHVAQKGTYIFHIINSESKVVIRRILFIE